MSQLFHPRANTIARLCLIALVFVGLTIVFGPYVYETSGYSTRVGQVINQPVPFSHQHHVTGLGIDCRYCHTSVEEGASAGMPATQTCMNCHRQMWTNADMLAPVRQSWRTNQPLHWNRVHDLPDYVYFNHSIHIKQGVECVTCHGDVGRMPLVHKKRTLQMQWCLDCHRDAHAYTGTKDLRLTDCSRCHR